MVVKHFDFGAEVLIYLIKPLRVFLSILVASLKPAVY